MGEGRERLDMLLVGRGLAESREQAQRLILAGSVEVGGLRNLKPGHRVACDAAIRVLSRERYVSRGGTKLEAALQAFRIHVEGQVCADIGASTGGFTDCLLQHGALRVYAVDVGKSQLHQRLRDDPRVIRVERCNARYMTAQTLGEPVQLLAIDCSFISLRHILPAALQVVTTGGACVALVKPQFEATAAEASRARGVIRSAAVHRRILSEVTRVAADLGWACAGLAPSPIAGAAGNREYLLFLLRGPAAAAIDVDAAIANSVK